MGDCHARRLWFVFCYVFRDSLKQQVLQNPLVGLNHMICQNNERLAHDYIGLTFAVNCCVLLALPFRVSCIWYAQIMHRCLVGVSLQWNSPVQSGILCVR